MNTLRKTKGIKVLISFSSFLLYEKIISLNQQNNMDTKYYNKGQ